MFYIIETKEQLAQLPRVEKCFIDLITLSEETHPKLTSPCILYYNDFHKGYIIPFNHTEGFSLQIEDVESILKDSLVYLFDKKRHSYFFNLPNTVDVHQTILDQDGAIQNFNCYTNVHNDFYNRMRYLENVNALIPISKHYERCECMFESTRPFITKERNLPWLNAYIDVYKWVEEQGIAIDEKLFDKYFEPTWKARSIRNGKIYTKYNLYNITSRPTNAFNGINFLAFTKDNHSRTAFIPQNDVFIEFDFDGYHPRLIANKLGIPFSNDVSVHTHLGQYYFGKQTLTQEEYQESKKITFRQLYNGVEQEYKHIEFFQEAANLIDDLWNTLQYGGYVELPNGRCIRGKDFSPQKLFNYYIQCLETVNNVEKLVKLKQLLEGKKSRVVLVVYDSILIDFSKQDGRETLNDIKAILEENNYTVKVKTGLNYDF